MVLAAGFGTRLRPHTLVRPKPLFPVLDIPLLQRVIAQLRACGVVKVVVNAHHLREQISALLADEQDVLVQLEEIELGTGGGLRLAMEHFGGEPFLAVNGDIVHDIDLAAVYNNHRSSGARVTMVLHDCPRFNNVLVGEDGRIVRFGASASNMEPGQRLLAFTGIQVIDPAVLTSMPEGVFWNIIDCYSALLVDGGRLQAHTVTGHFWTDMGTPADYLDLHGSILRQGKMADWLVDQDKTVVIGNEVCLGRDVTCEDWVVIGSRARIGDGCRLTRTVVWDGAQVSPGTVLSDCIVC